MKAGGRTGQQGYVLASVIFVAALLLATGVAVLWRVSVEANLAGKSDRFEQAWQAAMAGLEDCLGYINWDATGRAAMEAATGGEKICARSYSGDGYSYVAEAWANSPRQVKVRATGKSGSSSRTLGTVAQYTLNPTGRAVGSWGGGDMKFAGGGRLEGEIYSAKTINVTGNFNVCGNFYAYEKALRGKNVSDIAGCNVGFYSHYPWVTFPDFQVAALKSRADMIISNDYTPECSASDVARSADCDGPVSGEKVVWVKGKLFLKNYQKGGRGRTYRDLTYTGRVIYITDAGVDISVDKLLRSGDAMVQVIADGLGQKIIVSANGEIEGIFVAPEGEFATPGTTTVRGLVFASVWNNDGTLVWIADPQSGACTGGGCLGARMTMVKLWEE